MNKNPSNQTLHLSPSIAVLMAPPRTPLMQNTEFKYLGILFRVLGGKDHRLTIVIARSTVCAVVCFSLTSWVRKPLRVGRELATDLIPAEGVV